MLIFEIISWVLFGVTLGGMVAFFLEEWGHTLEHVISGASGALVGGILGRFLVDWIPSLDLSTGNYSFTALFTSLIFSIAAVFIERATYRRGRHVFRDPRADVP